MIAYNLVIDNKRIADETAKLQIRDFYLASSPPSESFMVKYGFGGHPHSPAKAHPERMPDVTNLTPRLVLVSPSSIPSTLCSLFLPSPHIPSSFESFMVNYVFSGHLHSPAKAHPERMPDVTNLTPRSVSISPSLSFLPSLLLLPSFSPPLFPPMPSPPWVNTVWWTSIQPG